MGIWHEQLTQMTVNPDTGLQSGEGMGGLGHFYIGFIYLGPNLRELLRNANNLIFTLLIPLWKFLRTGSSLKAPQVQSPPSCPRTLWRGRFVDDFLPPESGEEKCSNLQTSLTFKSSLINQLPFECLNLLPAHTERFTHYNALIRIIKIYM